MIPVHDPTWFLPLLLYAETHYRFRYFLSFLKKKEPEILADAPHSIEPGQPLPLLLLAKDAHLYPCTLTRAHITVRGESGSTRQIDLLSEPVLLHEPYWWKVFSPDVREYSGWIELDVAFTIEAGGLRKTYHNDNYRTSSHKPLRVYIASEPTPRFDRLYFGDAHTHSNYTEDQVEFGAPLEASLHLCRSMGLSFFCTTDHSYDLDDKVENYLENDPSLPKWHAFQKEVTTLNDKHPDFVILRGEEATVRNADDKNVHLLLYGNKTFVPGSGDSAEIWLRTRSEHAIQEAITLTDGATAPYAAHAQENVPLVQRLLLGRGSWSVTDLRTNKLAGLQFANGATDGGFWKGYKTWVGLLLEGKRLFTVAGNDAHGNFNRFRQLRIPFVMMKEMESQLFGKVRTGVFIHGKLTERSLLEAFTSGCMIISDGPVAVIHAAGNLGDTSEIGGKLVCKQTTIELRVISNRAMGWIASARVFLGIIGLREERILLEKKPGQAAFQFEETLRVTIDGGCYIRSEVWTSGEQSYDGRPHFCITNPIWLTPGP